MQQIEILHPSLNQTLSDAVVALSGMNGAQVHRSHWLNWDEVQTLIRKEGRILVQMSDGAEVPISRSKARMLKEQGYL